MPSNSDRIRKWSGYTVVVICAGVAGLSYIRPLQSLDPTKYFSLITALISALLLYVVNRLEKAAEETDLLKEKLGLVNPPVQVFHSIQEWANNLLKESRISASVYTQMFSDDPSVLGHHMKEYFDVMHREIRERAIDFKRLATTGNGTDGKNKVRWLLASLIEMADADTFSLAVVEIDHNVFPLNAFQVCRQGAEFAVFVFSSNIINPGGHTCMIRDKSFGAVAQKTFEQFWNRSLELKFGPKFYESNITKLAGKFDLLESKEYTGLMAAIQKRNQRL